MRYFRSVEFFGELLRRASADGEKRIYLENVPKACRQCELLGICRDRDRKWKCRKGCLIKKQMNSGR